MSEVTDTGRFCVGIITKPVGIKGDVKIHPYTSSPSAFLLYRDHLMLDSRPLSCISSRLDRHTGIIARFSDFQSRDLAESLRMKRLFVQRQSFPVLQDDEYYLYDLYNLEVISDLDNISIGRVAAAFDYGAGAFLEIILYANNELTALPFHKDSVISVNLVNKQIKIDRKFLIYNRPT